MSLAATLVAASPASAKKPGSGSTTGTGRVFIVNPVQSSGTQSLTDQHGVDNSFSCDQPDSLRFGKGRVDDAEDAEDAEVILHEYGHAVHDAQVPGFGTSEEAGSIGEAFGDHLAVADKRGEVHFDGQTWGQARSGRSARATPAWASRRPTGTAPSSTASSTTRPTPRSPPPRRRPTPRPWRTRVRPRQRW